MSDMIFYKNGEETFRISPPTVGTKCPETKLEVKKMTEIQKTEGEIKVLQAKLELLKEIEKHKTPVEEAYKRIYGEYPVTYHSSWGAFQDGYIAAQKDYKVGEYQPTPQEPEELKTLYDLILDCMIKYNSTVYPGLICDILDAVEEWMSQYADNVLRGECKKGYEECLSINLTLKELETLDKYLELNDKTRPLFDKIRNAYPKPTTLFDVRGRGKCLI
jgi:hypothetical protein